MRTPRFPVLLASLFLIAFLVWLMFDDAIRDFSARLGGFDLEFVHPGGAEDDHFWRETIAEFQKETGIRIRQKFLESLNDPSGMRMREAWKSQNPPDVALISDKLFRELADECEVLSAEADDSSSASSKPAGTMVSMDLPLEPTARNAFTVNGKNRGRPFAGSNLLIFANTKAFEKASAFHGNPVELPGEDWTVEQFLRTAEGLTCDFDRDGLTDQYGFGLPGWEQYLPFIWSFGANLTDERATQWTYSGPAAEAAMRFYRQLATGDRVAPRPDEMPNHSQENGFLKGTVAMCINGPSFASVLDQSDLALRYKVLPIPRGTGGRATLISWDGFVVRKNMGTARHAQAIRFVEYALSKPVQERLADSGRALPARTDTNPAFLAPDPPRRRPFVDGLAYSQLQPPLPGIASVDQAITRHFDEAVNPRKAFEATGMLDALARDPAIVAAFSQFAGQRP